MNEIDMDDTAVLDELAREFAQLKDEIDTAEVIADGGDDTSDDPIDRVMMDDLLAGYALLKGDQTSRTFVKGKEVFRNPEVILAERAARERVNHTRRQRIARQKVRRARIDAEREAKPLDSVRMGACLAMLGNLTGVVANLTMQRYNRFRRVLGDVMVDDIAQDAIIRIATSLAKSDTDLIELAAATMWLKDAPQPYVSADGPRGTGRLLGTIVTVVGRTIVDTYRASTTEAWVKTLDEHGKDTWERRDTTMESFELLETVAYNTRTDIDDMISKSKASGKPKQKGSPPGMREKRLFARAVVDCAIEARGLGWLANMILDEDRVRTDGSFKWTENADTIWAGFGFPTMNTDDPRKKAEYAKRAVCLAFEFLPMVIMAAQEIINDPCTMWYMDVHTLTQLVLHAAEHKKVAMEARYHIDGGASMEYTMRLMDDPELAVKALSAMYRNAEKAAAK